jgi:hypothetical protein
MMMMILFNLVCSLFHSEFTSVAVNVKCHSTANPLLAYHDMVSC